MNKAVLFDLDGVLVDACDWHYESLNRALKDLANFEISEEEHLETYNGLPTNRKLRILVEKGIINERDVKLISDLKQHYTVEVIRDFCNPDLTKIELLSGLKKDGYKLACVTNSIRETANLMLEKTGIIDLFDVILSNEDCEHNKPHPEPYIKALVLLNSLPELSTIVEDSPKGLEAARLTGASVIQVKNAKEVNLSLLAR